MPVTVPLLPFLRRRARRTPPPPPAVALTLVRARYQIETSVTLTFDRAIDIAGLVGGGVITVYDYAYSQSRCEATGAASLSAPDTVVIALAYVGDWGGAGVLLTAGAGTGIVAADDGGAWAGVTDLVLPFG